MSDALRAEEIFQEAADLPSEQRSAFIVRRCGPDAELLADVESLLRYLDRDDGRLLDVAQGGPPRGASPRHIGTYRIIRVIGEGGMGVVYEAVQESPRRTVALKVLRWALASPHLIRRFEHEADVLGQLKHPGIAQIYEAGSVQMPFGRQPFFAMELVAGKSLTAFASTQRPPLRCRLELLATICDAVHHAHQKGVIHRDLKPANILITEEGRPKVVDFGIARATDADLRTTTRTEAGALLGTLPYMSPEQATGDPAGVDTRSDVYSLGVILYELLAGKLPYELDTGIPEAARTIREREPTPLTSHDVALGGDISTIVGKSLQKEKERRYQSAAELAADIRRFLNDEPIAARPPTALYQIRKFAKRNRPLVFGALATLLTLVLGVVAASVLAVRATQNEHRALAYANRARLSAAAADLELHNAVSARQRLVQVPAALRGWEWQYMNGRADQSIATLPGDGTWVHISVGMVDGAELVAVASRDRRLRLWDPRRDAIVAETRERGEIRSPQFAPDGRTLVCSVGDGEPTLVAYDTSDPARMHERWRVPVHVNLGPRVFTPDSRRLVASVVGAFRLTVRDVATGEEVRAVPVLEADIQQLHVISDGLAILQAPGRTDLLDLHSGLSLATLPLTSATLVRRGAAAVGVRGSSIVEFDVAGVADTFEHELRRLPNAVTQRSTLSASDDGRLVAVTEPKGSIVLWNLTTGERITTLHGHTGVLDAALFSPTQNWLVSADSLGTVKVWDARSLASPAVATIAHDRALSVDISRDGHSTVTCGWGSVRLWDVDRGAPLWSKVAWRNREGIAPACAISPSGESVLIAGWDREAALLDSKTGAFVWRSPGVASAPAAAVWSPDGALVCIVLADGGFQSRSVASGAIVSEGSLGHAVTAVADDSRGRIACAGSGVIRIWDVEPLALQSQLHAGSGTVTALAFSDDGRRLVAADVANTLLLFDVVNRKLLAKDRAGAPVNGLSFTPDGSRIIAACEDGTIRLFDSARLSEMLLLDTPDGVPQVAMLRQDDCLVGCGPRTPVIAFDVRPDPARTATRGLYAEAADLVHTMQESLLTDQCIAQLRERSDLSPDLRSAAIEVARATGDQLNFLNSSAWADCRFAGKSAATYVAALARAEAVNSQWPGERSFINTLGVALYRAGDFARAIETLKVSDAMSRRLALPSDPEDTAFLAMAHHRRGDNAAARRYLAQALAGVRESSPTSEQALIVSEAVQLLGPEPLKTSP